MRKPSFRLIILLAATATVAADAPSPVLSETWESVLLDGARVGSFHTIIREGAEAGRFRSTTELDLTFKCYGSPVHLRREYGDEESSDGRVSALFMKQLQDLGRQLSLKGTVEGDRLHVVVDGGRIERRLKWSDAVLGLAAQERLLTDRRPKPGEQFSFLRYEPTFNTVVNVRASVKGFETVGADDPKLLRVELLPDRIDVPGTSVQPPGMVVWLDNGFLPVRREMELDGVGKVILQRATRETLAAAPATTADIGLRTLVSLDRRIPRPYSTRSAVYRITLKGEPAAAFARDGHQEVRNIRGDTFDLLVHPVQAPRGGDAGPAPDEYLSSNYYIDSNNSRIRDLAGRAVGNATDAWTKAVRIERWVSQSMHPENGAPLVPAGQVARELHGDCRAYAMLTAALCRAEGLPSRTAIGLLYVERGSTGPKLGFHMWTEVCIAGQWIGIDGTLGQGGVSACHLKISDHSWHATRSLTPLLPANRVLGKIAVEVVSVDGGT